MNGAKRADVTFIVERSRISFDIAHDCDLNGETIVREIMPYAISSSSFARVGNRTFYEIGSTTSVPNLVDSVAEKIWLDSGGQLTIGQWDDVRDHFTVLYAPILDSPNQSWWSKFIEGWL